MRILSILMIFNQLVLNLPLAQADADIYLQAGTADRDRLGDFFQTLWKQNPSFRDLLLSTIQDSLPEMVINPIDPQAQYLKDYPLVGDILGLIHYAKQPGQKDDAGPLNWAIHIPKNSVAIDTDIVKTQVTPSADGKIWNVKMDFSDATATVPHVELGAAQAKDPMGTFQKIPIDPNQKPLSDISGSVLIKHPVVNMTISVPEKGTALKVTSFSTTEGPITANFPIPDFQIRVPFANGGDITAKLQPQERNLLQTQLNTQSALAVGARLVSPDNTKLIATQAMAGIQSVIDDHRSTWAATFPLPFTMNMALYNAINDTLKPGAKLDLSLTVTQDGDKNDQLRALIQGLLTRRATELSKTTFPLPQKQFDAATMLFGVLRAIYDHQDNKTLSKILGLSNTDIQSAKNLLSTSLDKSASSQKKTITALIQLAQNTQKVLTAKGLSDIFNYPAMSSPLQTLAVIDGDLSMSQDISAKIDEDDTQLQKNAVAFSLSMNSLLGDLNIPNTGCGPAPLNPLDPQTQVSANLTTLNHILEMLYNQGTIASLAKGSGFDIVSPPKIETVPGNPHQMHVTATMRATGFTKILGNFSVGADIGMDTLSGGGGLQFKVLKFTRFQDTLDTKAISHNILSPVTWAMMLLINPFGVSSKLLANLKLHSNPADQIHAVPIPQMATYDEKFSDITLDPAGWIQVKIQATPPKTSSSAGAP